MSDFLPKSPLFEADWFDPMDFLEFLQLDEANPISKSFADKEKLEKQKAKEDARTKNIPIANTTEHQVAVLKRLTRQENVLREKQRNNKKKLIRGNKSSL